MHQFMKDNNEKRLKYQQDFQHIFKRSLGNYWDLVTGFDIVKFDEEVIKPPDGISTSDQIRKDYGEYAVKVIEGLI